MLYSSCPVAGGNVHGHVGKIDFAEHGHNYCNLQPYQER